MPRTTHAAASVIAAALALLPVPSAVAGTEAAPEVSDIAGDANLIAGNSLGPDLNVSTAPASVDSADLRAIWLRTAYDKVVTTVNGVRHVHHEPKALLVNFKTTAPARPTAGPSVIFRFPAYVNGSCSVFFEAWIKGSAPGAVDRQYAALNHLGGCAATGVATTGLSLTFSGNVTTMTVPFDASLSTLANGMEVRASSRSHVRGVLGANATYCCTVPVIDEAPLGQSFVIGSDVPPDVDCGKQPAHPDCQ